MYDIHILNHLTPMHTEKTPDVNTCQLRFQTCTKRHMLPMIRGIGHQDETKTKASHRVIKAPASALTALRHYRAWQQMTFIRNGKLWNKSSHVFVTQNGTPMHPDTLTGWFKEFIKTTDLPPIHIHSLRHTNATLQIANGVSVTTVAGILGHSNANTTTKVYAHAIQSAAAASAEMMDNLLNPVRKQA